MGFGEKWRNWIFSCLKSATISVLINGSPTKEFKLGRGVRQGDPLSLFLFILASEGLNILMKAAFEWGYYKGVKVGKDSINVTHLQYADDAMFFGSWSKGNEVQHVAARFNCQMGKLPFMLTLVKSVLNSLPLYYFSIYRAPSCVIKELERVRRNFFWGGNNNDNKMSWGNGDGGFISNLTLFGPKLSKACMVQVVGLMLNLPIDFSPTLVRGRISFLQGDDSWKWTMASSGRFSTKELHSKIKDKVNEGISAHVETLNNNLVPKKIEVFVWRARLKRLAVRMELDKQGVDLHSILCPLCNDEVESVEHTLILCKHAMEVWERVYRWWGFANVLNLSVTEAFLGNSPNSITPLQAKAWQAVEWVSGYLIWKNRN
ncbi:uncharacterized protein [Rutidosis leptorrhynchoides]|uniref:uncharacterized protein n=1 Tax=Rutidosis leptorrhynchoides TaxID=125765 RepID=UPI003A9A39DC